MCPVDSLALANKKNLVDKSKLVSELHRISKEERTDMRLLNNAKQRFKSRYNKLDSFITNDKTENDPSDVIMYETHNPGFCYRRNGECRTTQSPIKNTSLAYNDIHGMVFSDDEVDIDKILCLHLLRAHTTETLSPPSKNQKSGTLPQRDQSPLERLIERSKKKYVEDKMIKMLPIHVLDVSRGKTNENFIRDGRLAARLIINEKLNQLIKSVMMALENSNGDKLKELVAKAHNEDYLRHLICHSDMQDFINSLNGFNVISCCESFIMTPPFKYIPIEISINTPTGYVESLVNQIRRNIFKLPINCCWDNAGNNFFQLYYNPLECPRRTEDVDGKEKEIFSERLDDDTKIPSTSGTTSSLLGKSKVGSTPRNAPSSLDSDSSTTTIQPVEKTYENYKNPGNITKMNLDEVAEFITKKAKSAIQKDMKNLQIVFPIENTLKDLKQSNTEANFGNENTKNDENQDLGETSRLTLKSKDFEVKKYSLKQTTCPACSEKWKIPLPPPKTSVIRRNVLNQKQEMVENHQNDSSHHLSVALDRELKFWNQYNTKSSRSIISASMKLTPKRFYRSNVIEIIDLDELDLAKIRQQIRERETQKKLDQFLTH